MSTKIWEAYRIKKGYVPWDVCMEIKRRGREVVTQKLETLYAALKEDFDSKSESRADYRAVTGRGLRPNDDNEWDISPYQISHYVKCQYGKQLSKMTHDMWNFDVSVTVRHWGTRWLLIPYAPQVSFINDCLDFLRDMPELEDYHYQNQVDRATKDYQGNPITAQQWGARARVWDEITSGDNWQKFMIIDIVDYTAWMYIDPPTVANLRLAMEHDRKEAAKRKKRKAT